MQIMRLLFLCTIVLVFTAIGCKEESKRTDASKVEHKSPLVETKPKNSAANNVSRSVNTKEQVVPFDPILPDMCAYITPEVLSSILGKPVEEIEIKDASNTKTGKSRTCFYKLLNQAPANAGIMINAEVNPLPEEVANYHTAYIAGKKTIGENSIEADKAFIYKDFPGFGDDGAYSYELSKYLWRIGEDIGFMIAFNTNYSPKEQKKIAEKIATEIMKNFNQNR